jgi:hypothetical protein
LALSLLVPLIFAAFPSHLCLCPIAFAVILSEAKDPEALNPPQPSEPFCLKSLAKPFQSPVKPQNNKTPRQTGTIAWHSSLRQTGKIETWIENEISSPSNHPKGPYNPFLLNNLGSKSFAMTNLKH